MNRVIFISNLTVWSIKRGFGGPAFWQTLVKYSNEHCQVVLISDEPTNIDCDNGMFENIVIQESKYKKYCQIRFIGPVFRYLDHRYITRQYMKTAEQFLGESENTILYAYEVWGVLACKRLSKKYHVPLITRFQGTVLSSYTNSVLNRIRKYPHFSALETSADLTIMTDDGTQGNRVLEELNNKSSKVLFLRNGLELLSLNLNELKTQFDRQNFRRCMCNCGNEELLFLTVSRLVKWKHVERAIKGFADYCQKGGYGKLIIVGDGDDKQSLIDLSKKLNIDNKIVFIGAVKHEEVYNFMMACDVFLSLYDLSNVGNPLLEAMALGKPIITLNVGDTNKVIVNKQNGILIDPSELCQLGEIMIEISKDSAFREKIGRNAALYAQENLFSWEDRMNREYKQVEIILNKMKGTESC